MATEARQRVFLALWPTALEARRMHDYCRSLAVAGGRRIPADRLHVTLAFIGDVDAAELTRVRDIAREQRVEQGHIRFDRVRFVRRGQMLWAQASQPPASLSALANSLTDDLRADGFPLERRPWKAHVTLMRRLREAADLPAPDLCWAVSGFSLMSSRLDPAGAHYQELARFPAI